MMNANYHQLNGQFSTVSPSQRQQNGAELLVRCLEKEGVEFIFGVPGEENLHVLHALKHSSIQFITTRHEQGAAFSAKLYGLLTGKAGVCLSTLGPGATNLITGVADAHLDRAPLVAITGQTGTSKLHLNAHQYINLVEMFAPVTKWNAQIVRPDNIPEIVRKGFKLAQSEKQGAVHIDLPEDIAAMPADGQPLQPDNRDYTCASVHSIVDAAALILRASNPLILVGNGAIRGNASTAVMGFATHLQIPAVNSFMAKGVIPDNNPLALGTVGLLQDYTRIGFEQFDLIVAIGYDLIESSPKTWNPRAEIPIIHIDTIPAGVDRNYPVLAEVVGDISHSLYEIIRLIDRQREFNPKALQLQETIEAELARYAPDDRFPMQPQTLIYHLRQVMGQEDIVISDVGAHKMLMARYYSCFCPHTCIISNGFAAMGVAVPGAIAAKLTHPHRKVVAVTGDGGFLMNCQELETALRIGTPFVTLIFNDGGYGLIKWKQHHQFGESTFVKFSNPDFVKLAESMGIKGYRINSIADLIPTLNAALEQQVPAIIDCPVDYSRNLVAPSPQSSQGSIPTRSPSRNKRSLMAS